MSGTLREFYESRNGGDVDIPKVTLGGSKLIDVGMFGVTRTVHSDCGEFSLFHIMGDSFAILNLGVNNQDDFSEIDGLINGGVPSAEIVNDYIDSFDVLSWIEGDVADVTIDWDLTVGEFLSEVVNIVWDKLPRG